CRPCQSDAECHHIIDPVANELLLNLKGEISATDADSCRAGKCTSGMGTSGISAWVAALSASPCCRASVNATPIAASGCTAVPDAFLSGSGLVVGRLHTHTVLHEV